MLPVQLCQPDLDDSGIVHCEIIVDPSDYRHNTVTSYLQRLSLFERSGGDMGWSIGHRSGGSMSCA